MKERWKNAPSVLRRKVIKSVGGAVLLGLIGIISWIASKKFMIALPCFVLSAVWFFYGVSVLFSMLTVGYIMLSGTCEKLEQTLLFKRTKAMYLTTNYGVVKVLIRHNARSVEIGSYVRCYISLKAPVYELNDVKVVNDYYTIEVMD